MFKLQSFKKFLGVLIMPISILLLNFSVIKSAQTQIITSFPETSFTVTDSTK